MCKSKRTTIWANNKQFKCNTCVVREVMKQRKKGKKAEAAAKNNNKDKNKKKKN